MRRTGIGAIALGLAMVVPLGVGSAWGSQPMSLSCAEGGGCAIGDTGPGGGIVFYDAGSVQPWGRYLEAAPAGWSGSPLDPRPAWCSNTTTLIPGAMGTAIGTGAANTATMLAACSSGAANLARSYTSPTVNTAVPGNTPEPIDPARSVATAPRGVRVVAGLGSVTVSWQPPSDNGGSKVTTYVVTATPGARTCSTSGSSCRVTGLSGGKTYTFDVVARNGVGEGEAATSKPVRVPTAASRLGAPPPKKNRTNLLAIGGKSDWFLPSRDELNAMFQQQLLVIGFGAANYWSSSQIDGNYAWAQLFTNGVEHPRLKTNAGGVRPIRSF